MQSEQAILAKTIGVKFSAEANPAAVSIAQALAVVDDLLQQGNLLMAEVILYQILQQEQKLNDVYAIYFNILNSAARFDELTRLCEEWVRHCPNHIPAYMNLAAALRGQSNNAAAIKVTRHALSLDPQNVLILNHLGVLEKEVGNLDVALEIFNACIAIQPRFNQVYWNRADLYRDITADELLAIEALAAEPTNEPLDKANYFYAIARGYEFKKDYPKSFYFFELGAKNKRASFDYDVAQDVQEVDRIVQQFSSAILKTPVANVNNHTPIFICGLPRSGTTLMEQIISSHPLVTGGEELSELSKAASAVLQHKKIEISYPEWAGGLNAIDWQVIGQEYLRRTQWLQKTPYFTDKMPLNYKALGVIHLALPSAKIIHCVRHPLDNLFGCYKQLFGDGLRFTYNLNELAEIYKSYNRLMTYWKSQFPEKILEVSYEKLIENQEMETRRILAFLELPWSEACLNFHENERAVYSASSSQVRQPMFTSSVANWRRYEHQLAGLSEQLKEFL